jgi:fructose-1,6-bisphosphatase II
MPVKLWPRGDSDRKKLVKEGFEEELSKVVYAEVLARGDGIIFCATGISDSPRCCRECAVSAIRR